MINTSDPLEYIPSGQLAVINHPEFNKNDTFKYSNIIQSTITDNINGADSHAHLAKDFWVLRNNLSCQEEELFCYANLAVYTKGNEVSNTLQTSYFSETDIKHAIWCTFYLEDKNQMLKSTSTNLQKLYNSAINCICLIDSYTLKVFTELGESYISSLQFKVSSVWPTKYGILLEKSISQFRSYGLSFDNTRNTSSTEESDTPRVFSLSHPLDDICPLLIKHGNLTYVYDSSLRIIFTSVKPSVAFIFDSKTALHSIYKIRKASQEECQVVNTNASYPSVNCTPFNSPSLYPTASAGYGIKNSANKTLFSNIGGSASPFRSKTSSHTPTCSVNISISSQHLSRSQSPMATISRCHSPTNPMLSVMSLSAYMGYNVHHSKSQHTLLAHSMGRTEHNTFCQKSANHYLNNSSVGMSLPEICLELVWTENPGLFKDNKMEVASTAFFSTDLIGQSYFCYLLPEQCRFYLIRLEKSNDPEQIILGMVTTITAKNAINIPDLQMIGVIEIAGSILLYSGTNVVGKLHIPSTVTNVVGNSFVLSSAYRRDPSSPYPRRSSLISSNKLLTADIKFDDGVHLLSPVCTSYNNLNIKDNTLLDWTPIQIKSAILNKLIFDYGNSNYFKITVPTFKASSLVQMCLQTLRNILPRDLSMQLLIKWYIARNAPGPQDLSLSQEWNLFLNIFFTFFGYDINKLNITKTNIADHVSEHFSPTILSKKQKTLDNGSDDDWSYIITSELTNHVQDYLIDIINLNTRKEEENYSDLVRVKQSGMYKTKKCNIHSTSVIHLSNVLFALHLLYEEVKLSCYISENLFLLGKLLYQLSMDLNLNTYCQHYVQDFPVFSKYDTEFQINEQDINKTVLPNLILLDAPNLLQKLYDLLINSNTSSYPYIFQINPLSRSLIQLFTLINGQNRINILELDYFFKNIHHVSNESSVSRKSHGKDILDDILMHFHSLGVDKRSLDNFPSGINFVFSNIIYQCRENPPSIWPSSIYELIDRQDLATLETNIFGNYFLENTHLKINCKPDTDRNDGMEFDYTILKLRFNKDHRVREVRKLLDSSEPVKISIVQRPDVSDHEFIEEQEKYLHALCTRTMALPIGRGMFTLRTAMPINTEQLPIPRLCLTGKAPHQGTTIELTHIDVPPNMNLWPLFHNGVATGLCIHPAASNVDSTWIVYNKQQQGEFGIEHSGFLMALGLNGHLRNLAPFSMYEYLVECHEATSVGLLLGLSATHRSSMDVSMTKLLSLHVETLLPPTSIELNVQQNVQVAALMGVGVVYQGTNHHHIAHALLSEIGRPPGPEMKNCVDRESYSLTAGLALGLVVLGSGGRTDLANIPDTLHYYMVGGNTRPFCGAQKDKYKSPSYQIREGDTANIDVTSPGATLALGLMYLKSGNRSVAEWMTAPNTQYLLDFVRPDLLLLRVLAKSLILWDEIEPSKTWISSHVPDIVVKYKLRKPTSNTLEPVDLETINQAYCNIIAGGCMAVGLKYAGTEDMVAFKTLYHFLKMFMTLTHKSIAELAGKATIETCLNTVLLSASIVMAGTGNLEILRVCRYIRSRVSLANSVITYGSHVATHMALGFLFMGGGSLTLSNDPSSVAALIISLFPKFPTHSNDNRYHLQALRHFYVLATESRLLLPKDIDNRKLCYANVQLTFLTNNQMEGQKIRIKAPCLLPQLDRLHKVEVDDDRYWKIVFEKERNFKQLKRILNANCVLHVKQRAGCLSHMEDPQGFRTLLAQTLTTEDVIVWTASLKQITSFTMDATIINFITRFLKKGDINNQVTCDNFCMNKLHDNLNALCFAHSKNAMCQNSNNLIQVIEIPQEISTNENHYLQSLITMTYECVIRDKIDFLPLWVNIYNTILSTNNSASSNFIWQMNFLCLIKHFNNYLNGSEKLLNAENILANKQRIYFNMDAWQNDLLLVLKHFLTMDYPEINIESFKKFIAYILHNSMTRQLDGFAVRSETLCIKKSSECIKTYGIYKIYTLSKTHSK